MNLDTQAQFEELFFDVAHPDNAFLVYFTAAWCGPCKRLDVPTIAAAAAIKGIPFYKCDYVTNEYTPGYCGVRAFPTFVLFKPKKVVAQAQTNNTEEVCAWIHGLAL
jgi:thiol-disulfide isomerase/thioredoxin